MVKNLRLTALIGVFALSVAGCATVTSTPIPNRGQAGGTASNRIGEGVTYFLPRQLARVTVKRNSSKVAKAAKDLTEAESNLALARTELTTAQAELRTAEDAIIAGSDTQDGRDLLNARRTAAQGVVGVATATVAQRVVLFNTAVAALRTAVADPANYSPGAASSEIGIALLDPSADPDFTFALSPRHSILRDDNITVALSRTGLLTSTNVVAEDRTDDILVEIATLAGVGSGLGGARSSEDHDCTGIPMTNEWLVDFTDSNQTNALNEELECYGLKLEISSPEWTYTASASAGAPLPTNDGLYYRTPVEIEVTIQRRIYPVAVVPAVPAPGPGPAPAPAPVAPIWVAAQQIGLLLPQAGPIAYINQDSGALTRRSYTLAFDNGILTSYQNSRPGEALEIAATPIRMIRSFAGAVTEGLGLRSSRATAETNLANALATLDRAGINNEQQRNAALLGLLTSQGQLQNGALANETSTNTALLNLLNSQGLLANRSIALDTERLTALLLQFNAQSALANGGLVNEQARNALLLSLLGSQNQLSLAQINTPPTMASAELDALIRLVGVNARAAQLESCLLAQMEAGTPNQIDICLVSP